MIDNHMNQIPHFLDFEGKRAFAEKNLKLINESLGDEKALEKTSNNSKQILKKLKSNPCAKPLEIHATISVK